MIKVIFFDIDGTLFSHKQKAIPESAIKALNILKDKGIKRVIASGRHKQELIDMGFNYQDFDGYIMMNGQITLDHNFKVIDGNPIKGKTLETILKLFNEKKYPIQLNDEDKLYINLINDEVIKAQETINTPLQKVLDYDGKDIYLSTIFAKDILMVKSSLDDCNITAWNHNAFDIVSKGSSKSKAIEKYLKDNHIDVSESMAFGDGENDKEMISFVGKGVAMGNAIQELKDIADDVCGDIDEDGLFNYLKSEEII